MIRQIRADTDVQEMFRTLTEGCPLLLGKELDLNAAASTAAQSVRHGLGRPYAGAFVVFSDSAAVLRALDPRKQANPSTYLYYALSTATATVARVWVYLALLAAVSQAVV